MVGYKKMEGKVKNGKKNVRMSNRKMIYGKNGSEEDGAGQTS